jgi:hypothetical protein
LVFVEDRRIGGEIRYRITANPKELMQIPNEVRKCVGFLALRVNDGFQFLGTAFFIVRPTSVDSTRTHVYAVTAKHIFDALLDDDEVCIRLNKKDGTMAWVWTNTSDWITHPSDSSVDVAVIRCILPEDFDQLAFPLNGAATSDVMTQNAFGVGEEVFLTGLFYPHSGTLRNIPIVRTGNIAALPEEKVRTKKYGLIDAYLIEARSIGGLSGSPVFIYSSGHRTVGDKISIGGAGYYLLGLMHGHWDTAASKVDSTEDKLTEEKINMGIAIVVPVEKILEVLEHPSIKRVDAEAEQKLIAEKGPTAD